MSGSCQKGELQEHVSRCKLIWGGYTASNFPVFHGVGLLNKGVWVASPPGAWAGLLFVPPQRPGRVIVKEEAREQRTEGISEFLHFCPVRVGHSKTPVGSGVKGICEFLRTVK